MFLCGDDVDDENSFLVDLGPDESDCWTGSGCQDKRHMLVLDLGLVKLILPEILTDIKQEGCRLIIE